MTRLVRARPWPRSPVAVSMITGVSRPTARSIGPPLRSASTPSRALTFEAGGRYYQFGQAPAPELPWPAFDVTGYVAVLDYARKAVHARYRRVQVQEPGRARPHTDQTQDQYAVDGHSWNLTAGADRDAGQPGGAERRAVDVAAGLHQGGARARGSRHAGAAAAARQSRSRSIACSATKAWSAPPATCSGCAPSWIRRSPATRRWNGASPTIATSAACASRPASSA